MSFSDAALDEVATFIPGQKKEQGRYILNETGWKCYDPIFALHRATLIKDMENGKRNFISHFQSESVERNLHGLPLQDLPNDVTQARIN